MNNAPKSTHETIFADALALPRASAMRLSIVRARATARPLRR